jgi:hypothetical protein
MMTLPWDRVEAGKTSKPTDDTANEKIRCIGVKIDSWLLYARLKVPRHVGALRGATISFKERPACDAVRDALNLV